MRTKKREKCWKKSSKMRRFKATNREYYFYYGHLKHHFEICKSRLRHRRHCRKWNRAFFVRRCRPFRYHWRLFSGFSLFFSSPANEPNHIIVGSYGNMPWTSTFSMNCKRLQEHNADAHARAKKKEKENFELVCCLDATPLHFVAAMQSSMRMKWF